MREVDEADGRAAGTNAPTGRIRRFVPAFVVAAGLAAGYALGLQRYLSLDFLAASSDALTGYAAAHPVLAPSLFFAAYVAAVAFSFPAASVLTIFGGFLFGWLAGGTLVAFAATLGATLLFLAARGAFADMLRRRLGGFAGRVAAGFEEDAFGYLLALRLAPIFPFFVVNIAPAFLKVGLRTYVAATFLGILPGTFAYAWLGQGVGSVIGAARKGGHAASLADLVTPQITLAFALLALVAALPPVVRRIRRQRGHSGGRERVER